MHVPSVQCALKVYIILCVDSIFKTIFIKCQKNGCQTYTSIRRGNQFFTYIEVNDKCNNRLNFELKWNDGASVVMGIAISSSRYKQKK